MIFYFSKNTFKTRIFHYKNLRRRFVAVKKINQLSFQNKALKKIITNILKNN
jgi:hypothetical protein